MYIPESATHQCEYQISRRVQEKLQMLPQELEDRQHSHAILQAALAATGVGVWDWNLLTNKTYYDPQWKRILGYESDEVENHHNSFEQLVHPEDLPTVMGTLQAYLDGSLANYEVEFRMQAKSGEWKWIQDRGQIFERDDSGKPTRMSGTHRDITTEKSKQLAIIQQAKCAEAKAAETSRQLEALEEQLRQIQEQLLRNENMANLGVMVADMVNEIINPVNFIYGNLHPASQYSEELIRLIELYQYYYPTPNNAIACQIERIGLDFVKTDLLKLIWSMRAGAERVKGMVVALQDFVADNKQILMVDLHQGLNSVLRILQHRLKEKPERARIEVIKEFGELPLVECYPSDLNQVFMNILNNAIDTLEERMKVDYSFLPQIRITTEVISSHLSLVAGTEVKGDRQIQDKKQKVVIRISDNGKGILPHVQRRIFEPFFTTKPPGQGKGLGLSISQELIVDKHQGKLKCYSLFGQGTEFIIEINTALKFYANIKKIE